MTTTYQLLQSYSAVFNSSGNATIRGVGPTQYTEEWQIVGIQTQVTGSAAQSVLRVYQNNMLVEGTYSGNLDTSDTRHKLSSGESLVFEYTAGDPAAVASITVRGERTVAGDRAGYR